VTKLFQLFKKSWPEIAVFAAAFLFSWWLMWHTFQYKNGEIWLASKVWSDFQAHIPLIRSFSLGDNFPPEYPLFPGEKIRYHFLFYLLVGFLEKFGVRLDWALNLPSVLGFAWFLIMIYLLGKELTKSRGVGILSVILYLFNGSFSFVKYFTDHGWDWNSIANIFKLTNFPSYYPYGPGIVSAFWNWNIFSNQRHLGLAFAMSLTGIYLIWKEGQTWKRELFKTIGLVVILVVLSWLHKAVFLMSTVVYAVLLMTNLRKSVWSFLGLGLGVVLSIPAVLYMSPHAEQVMTVRLGFLSDGTWRGFIWWWFMNMGLVLPGALLGFMFGNKALKKLFLAFTTLFIIGNTIAFSPEIAANHKFFNLFMVGCVILVANLLVLFWRARWWQRAIVIMIFPILVLSGIIDMFPVINEFYYHVVDKNNPAKNWIMANTSKGAVFLNSTFFDNPATLAGRKIYYGWPYFTWSLGYDTDKRLKLIKQIYGGEDVNTVCYLLEKEGIDYLETHSSPGRDEFTINYQLFEDKFFLQYENPITGLKFYDVESSCVSYF